MENDKLVINGTRYGISNLYKLPPELAPYKSAEKCNEEYIAFQGEHSPFSNFHHSPFQLNNIRFANAEQWIQHQKCLLFGDVDTAGKVLETDNPIRLRG